MNEKINKYKRIISIAGVTLLSTVTLAACSSGSNKMVDVATYKSGKVSAADAYFTLKFNTQNQTIVKNLAILDVYNSVYGNDIKDKQVDDVFNKYKANYESDKAFDNALKTSGYTTESFKAYLKKQLAYEYGVKKNMKVTNDDLKTEWEKYQPDQKAKIMVFVDETAANEAKEALNNGGDFDKIASEKSASQSTDVTVRYNDSTLPDNIKENIYKMKNGDVSDIMTYSESTEGQKIYYIVKLVEKKDKPKSMDSLKDELTTTIKDTRFANGTGVDEIVRKELAKQNFKVSDDDFKTTFKDLIEGTSSNSSNSSNNLKKTEVTSQSSSTSGGN